MPILEYHLPENTYTEAQCERLLLDSTRHYAAVLKSPLERIRVLIHQHKPSMVAVGGQLLSKGGAVAPFFYFLVLEGRPEAERQALLAGFTDLVVDVLGVERALVRGGCWPIPPQDWAIGGVPASVLRAGEVQSRIEESRA